MSDHTSSTMSDHCLVSLQVILYLNFQLITAFTNCLLQTPAPTHVVAISIIITSVIYHLPQINDLT